MKKTAVILLVSLLTSALLCSCNTNEKGSNPNVRFLITELTQTTPEGSMKYVSQYDDEGKRIEQTAYKDGEEQSVTTFTYDENGNENGFIFVSPEYTTTEEWMNDEEGRIISRTSTTESPSETSVTVDEYQYEYTDDNGSYVMTSVTNGQSGFAYSYTYNDKHALIEETFFANGIEYSRTKYDEHGNPTEIISANGETTTYKNRYAGGLLKETTQRNSDGAVQTKTVYSYDEHGNVIMKVQTDGTGAVVLTTEIAYVEFEINK